MSKEEDILVTAYKLQEARMHFKRLRDGLGLYKKTRFFNEHEYQIYDMCMKRMELRFKKLQNKLKYYGQ